MNIGFQKAIWIVLLGGLSLNLSAQEAAIQFKNQLPVARKNELIELDRAFIEKKIGKLPKGETIEITGTPQMLTLQFDDLNLDGQWDKVVFLLSFKPAETIRLKMKLSGDFSISGPPVAHVRHRRKLPDNSFAAALDVDSIPPGQPNTDFTKLKLPPFLTEGPAWENDKVGFRIYMDQRNTKDIWGKTTADMMMDTVGVNPEVIYHHLAPWGMDILAVGKSLGAGSLAMHVPVTGKADTLVRLGGKNMGKVVYRKIADGPVRAVFQMEYPEWNVLGDGKLTSLTEQVSIWGGQYFYESRITLKNAPKGANIVTGIVNLKSNNSFQISNKNARMLYTFDQQSENNDYLGMAVLLNQKDLVSFGKTPNANSEVLNTYTVSMKTPGLKQATIFRFYSCWEHSDPIFATASGFKQYLVDESKTYNSPVVIK